jgi:phosphoenolpyruvate carboxylase
LPKDLEVIARDFLANFQSDEEHKGITDYIITSLMENKTDDLREYVLRAADLRKFLG